MFILETIELTADETAKLN